mmetsp:Transcript_80360/g.222277  ORF Transcript_80360/g.222277 Transcript_80360/m.222277 type:complete len:292 (+) Transcript_80360:334-1209(+)
MLRAGTCRRDLELHLPRSCCHDLPEHILCDASAHSVRVSGGCGSSLALGAYQGPALVRGFLHAWLLRVQSVGRDAVHAWRLEAVHLVPSGHASGIGGAGQYGQGAQARMQQHGRKQRLCSERAPNAQTGHSDRRERECGAEWHRGWTDTEGAAGQAEWLVVHGPLRMCWLVRHHLRIRVRMECLPRLLHRALWHERLINRNRADERRRWRGVYLDRLDAHGQEACMHDYKQEGCCLRRLPLYSSLEHGVVGSPLRPHLRSVCVAGHGACGRWPGHDGHSVRAAAAGLQRAR